MHIHVGDLVRIAPSKVLELVVEAGEKVDTDYTRGGDYRVFQFKTVMLKKSIQLRAGILPVIEPTPFYLLGGTMSGKGIGVKAEDVKVVGSVDSVKPIVSYRIGRVRLLKD
jgi:hypothetical protein